MRFSRLLGFRLFLIVLGVTVAGAAVFTTLNVRWQTDRHMRAAVKTAARISDVIKRSTHYSMALNRREDIYHTINTIGNEPGIETIRIYNKQGVISFSTDSNQVGRIVDMNAEACNACHQSNQPPTTANLSELTRIFRSPRGHDVLGLITPIYNEPSCSAAACHAHSSGQTMLGVLDVMLPLTDVEAATAETTKEQYTLAVFLILAVSSVTGLFIWVMVNIPVRQLTRGTAELMKGNLGHRIPVRSNDEVGVLAASFNQMTGELQRARQEITEWTQTLETRVAEKTEELRRAQRNMIHVEKMASLGQLAATVAHELNNPLEGVLTYAKLLRKRVAAGELKADEAQEIRTELSFIAEETARCGNIVKNLLLFSRQEMGEMESVDLLSVVQRSVKLIDHHLKMHNIRLILDAETPPYVALCDRQQIEQALIALEINATEAMPDGGTLRLGLRREGDDHVEIIVKDSGCGIREEDLQHIFEPFFTTKENGKGTGLGLAVVYGIVQRHAGRIDVQSSPGKGTTFTLKLPVRGVPANREVGNGV